MSSPLCVHVLGDGLCGANPTLVREARGVCDKTIRDCLLKFDNVDRFSGFKDPNARPYDRYAHLPPGHPDRFPITRYFAEHFVTGEVIHHTLQLPPKADKKPADAHAVQSFLDNMERRGSALHYVCEISAEECEDPNHHDCLTDFFEAIGWSRRDRKFLRETRKWKKNQETRAS